jgi:hypothetical protein
MNFKISTGQKILIAVLCFAVAITGFMIKLPSGFRHIDKELHAAFYFLAAAFLNILFARTNLIRHAVIFAFLYFFGMAIEYAQAYSNKFFRKRIHGRFDPEDVAANLNGLIAFSVLWLVITLAIMIFRKSSDPGKTYNSR